MKIVELKYTERKNFGSYEFAELSSTAVVEEGDDMNTAILTLKTFVHSSLNGEIEKLEVKQVEVQQEAPKVEEVKEKKTRKKKEEVKEAYETNTEVIPPVIEVASEELPPVIEKVEAEIVEATKKYEKYDRGIKEHTSFLAGHLTKCYGNTWKSKEGLQAFSQSLTGTDFRDKKSGELVSSFISKLEGFFGASNSVL